MAHDIGRKDHDTCRITVIREKIRLGIEKKKEQEYNGSITTIKEAVMSDVITIYSHKGGITKTTSTVNLGAALALRKKRVLILDMDAQAHVVLSLCGDDEETFYPDGVYNEDAFPTILDVLEGREAIENAVVEHQFCGALPDAARKDTARLDFIPGSTQLDFFSADDPGHFAAEMKRIRDRYDYILIDCPPAWTEVTGLAMMVSDYVISPLPADDQKSLSGITATLDSIGQVVASGVNRNLTFLGLFFVLVQPGRGADRRSIEALREIADAVKLFDTFIPYSNAAKTAGNEFRLLCDKYPKNPASRAYDSLALELIERTGRNSVSR